MTPTGRCAWVLALSLVVTGMSWAQTLKWEPRAKMPIGKGGQVCGIVAGKLLVAGGTYWIKAETKVWTGDVGIYDPATDTWSQGPDLPFPLSYGAGDAVGGRLYIVSGSDGKRDFRETVIGAQVNGKLQWLWGPPLPAPRLYPACAVIGTKLYLIGGAPDRDLQGKLYGDVMVLDTAHLRDGWKSLRRMPGEGRVMMAAAAVGDLIYVFGGYQQGPDGNRNSHDAFVYDTVANRWQRLAKAPFAARCWDAVALGGQVYLLGGYVTWPLATGRPEGFTDKVLRFDPAAGTYTPAGELLLPVTEINPRLLPDGRVLVNGGEDIQRHRTDVVAVGSLR